MAELGIVIAPGSGPYSTLGELAREAEDAGFSGVFVSEAANDALMCCYLMALVTRRIKFYTWIVNIHLRVPSLCAAAAVMVQEGSQGRFILGLGVSHRPALRAMGIEMGNGRDKLRAYTEALRQIFKGEPISPALPIRFRAPANSIPIYYAALSLETARLAGEIADGVELYMCSPERMRLLVQAAHGAAASRNRRPSQVAITMGIASFVHDDLGRAFQAARQRLGFYASLPFYNRQMMRGGFEAEAAAAMAAAQRKEKAALEAALSDRYLDSVALIGPPSRCLERLAAYREAGAEMPVIRPNDIDEDSTSSVRRAIKVFSNAI